MRFFPFRSASFGPRSPAILGALVGMLEVLALAMPAQTRTAQLAERFTVELEASAVPGPVVEVATAAELQAALDNIGAGGTLMLHPGKTYVGNFVLRARPGTGYVIITTRNAALPPTGSRITRAHGSGLATIRSGNTGPALATDPGASHYRIVGVAFEANLRGAGDIITLGSDAQASPDEVPHHLELDRILITGDPTSGQKRAIAVNAAEIRIENSDIRGIRAVGQDSQAIAGWNTPGPIVIRNNYLEAAGENIMFGGAHVNLVGAIPSDITVEDNTLAKNPEWRGSPWTVKNLFELKNARRVVVRRNTLEYNWSGAQSGYAVVFTPRNSSGRTPWAVVEDVEFSGNVIRHSGSAFNILGHDDTAPSGQLSRLLIRDNLLYDIDGRAWGGAGVFAQIGGEPRDLTFDHNTVIHTGNVTTFYSGRYVDANGVRVIGGPVRGFVFTNNLLRHNPYGVFGSGAGYGRRALDRYAPGAEFRGNVLATDNASLARRYPPGNAFPTLDEFYAGFVDPTSNRYGVMTGRHLGPTTDGKALGCDFDKLPADF